MIERSGEIPDGCVECQQRAAAEGARRGVDRRTLLTGSALAAVTALLASASACAGAGDATGPSTSPGSANLSVTVANYPALARVGGIARVDSGNGTPVAAVRTGASTFAAFSLICPHFGCTVGITGTSFQCPCHGARFAASGQWTGGQRTGNLTAFPTTYDATTGVLTIG
jgi:Rieske Fe-S protein